MKFYGGKSHYDASTDKWISNPRVYTDFHCTLKEWKNLNRGQENLVRQVLQYIVNQELMKNLHYTTDINGRMSVFLDIDIDGDDYRNETSETLIKNVIKLVTGLPCTVEFYSWKQSIDHVIISIIGGEARFPNIVVLFDDLWLDPEKVLVKCLTAIYETIRNTTYHSFNTYCKPYYNNSYDIIYNNSKESSCYYQLYNEWPCFRPKKDRFYFTEASLCYKKKE